MGGEQEVKGGRGQQGMKILSTFAKAAVTDSLGREFGKLSETSAISKHAV